MSLLTFVFGILLMSSCSLAGYIPTSKTNLAVYWGQNSLAKSDPDPEAQQTLGHYCKDRDVDIILLAFVEALNDAQGKGNVRINFANQLGEQSCNNTVNHPFTCPGIGQNITYCQNEEKKTVLLSLGGSLTSWEKGFESEKDAQDGAIKIWNMFGPRTDPGMTRPFGDAVVNGFDLDIENPINYLAAFGKKLRELTNQATNNTHKYYLSAAPQCPNATFTPPTDLRHQAITASILNEVDFDLWFVQFYNNPVCDITAGMSPTLNFTQWNDWAAYRNAKMFIGLPANTSAASTGYVIPTDLSGYFGRAKDLANVGGAMLWDASQAWANANYQKMVKQALAATPTASA